MPILDRFRLDGRTAIVTGASSGLGVAFATALAEAGADVVVAARRADRLEATRAAVEATGRRALAVRTDVSLPEDCRRLVETAMEAFGHVGILVNNAGVAAEVPASREQPDEFRHIIDVNLNGCYWMAQECGRVMQPGSSIVNISSVLGITTAGLPQAAYSASKAGLIGLTRDLAQQWTGRKGIRVNALCPGPVNTPLLTELFATDPERAARRLVHVPMGRFAEASEIAAAVAFLASDDASFMTAATFLVDGGISGAYVTPL